MKLHELADLPGARKKRFRIGVASARCRQDRRPRGKGQTARSACASKG